MAKQIVFLSHPLSADGPNPPAIPKPEFTPFMSLARGDGANVTLIKVASHTGSHIDAPSHAISDGISITSFRPEEFIFSHPVVLDIFLPDETLVMPDHLERLEILGKDADLILFRFGYGTIRQSEPARYSAKCSGFGMESAEYLLKTFPKVRCIGMDVPSLSCIAFLETSMKAHNILLSGNGGRFLILEDLKMDQDLSKLVSVIVAPWLVKDLDGGPVTVFGYLD